MPAHRVPNLYLDTSVVGGYFDKAFKDDTRELWRQMEKGLFRFYVSAITVDEVLTAPLEVRELAADTFTDPLLQVTPEADRLFQAYMKSKVIPSKFADDAAHVAVAVVHRMDFVVSWNFKHLANVYRNDAFNAVNLLQGYPPVRIVNPRELIYGQKL